MGYNLSTPILGVPPMSDWAPLAPPPITGWTKEGLPVGFYGDLLSITGPQGPPGPPGANGAPGATGPLNSTYTVSAVRPSAPNVGDIHVNPFANPTSTVLLGVQSYWRRFLTGVSL